MALNQRYMFFDTVDDDIRYYKAADFAQYFRHLFTNGLFRAANPLAVSADGISMNLNITAGSAMINGRYYELVENGSVAAPVSLTDLYYYVVLRLNLSTAVRDITLQLKPGTATAPPALQRDSSIHELAIAQIIVRANRAYISSSDVTDLRNDSYLCGFVQHTGDPAFYPPTNLPQLLWSYTIFPDTLTPEQIASIESNASLMSMFGRRRDRPKKLIATYTVSGAFVPAEYGLVNGDTVDVYMVAGGGAGGNTGGSASGNYASAGGGGGHCLLLRGIVVTSATYPIYIGAGGTSIIGNNGNDGGMTTCFGRGVSGGKGGGVGWYTANGGNGGSGGGGCDVIGNLVDLFGGSGGFAGGSGSTYGGTGGGNIDYNPFNPYDNVFYGCGGAGTGIGSHGGGATGSRGGGGSNGGAGGLGGGGGGGLSSATIPSGAGGNGIVYIYA